MKDYDIEIAGTIDKNNKIKIIAMGTSHSVSFPVDIEKDDNLEIMFHTHPYALNDAYYFHTENDMFESIRRFFNSGKELLNSTVISKYGIVNLQITQNQLINIKDTKTVDKVILEIGEFSYKDYSQTLIDILGDNGVFNKEKFNIAEEQYNLLKNYSKKLNDELNKKLRKYTYINKINIQLRNEYDL